ncbi:MAG: hypothetical protein IAE95_05330 [Chitinophagaceae bacterium]|nr:hypothetical protein [Chitinophagaceae bacterium]
MTLPRTYTVNDVMQFIRLIEHDPDISQEKVAGMKMLAEMLACFEHLSEAQIETEIAKHFTS